MHYVKHLSKDRHLRKLITNQGHHKLVKRKKVYLLLVSSIMSQQLSTTVARVIYKRFIELYGGKEPTAEQIMNTKPELLRSVGLSNAKVSYVQNVARFELEKGMSLSKLNRMSNEEVIEYLTEIKGVGSWTVEMLLMFTLAREDVFAVDDLGIQTVMKQLYKLDVTDKKKFKEDMIRISTRWSPYRTYACLYLWGHKDKTKAR
jgi:DNA-3-methyladenine glycosylase II